MKHILLLIICLMAGTIFAVNLQHVPPQTYMSGQDLQLMLEIQQGLEDITEINLYYRSVGDKRWMEEPAAQKTPGAVYYWAMIPGKYLTDQEVEYYFEVSLKLGTTEYFPPKDGIAPPYKVVPKGMTGDLSDGFVLLSDDTPANTDDGYMLAVSYYAIQDAVDPSSIEVWVSGKNVTADAQISAPTIVYRDHKPSPGVKKAVIKAKQGNKDIHSEIWATEVLPGNGKVAKPFTYRGAINFASNYYSASEEAVSETLPPSDATSWADLYGSYGILDLTANIYASSLESKNKQPVNRYTFGLQIPHLDIFAGDYSPTLSQYTLNNKNIKGIYSRLYSRYLTLAVAHGQSVRKTHTDVEVDHLNHPGLYSGTFKQEAFGARLQFGNESGAMMGFNVSRHRDIISSLDKEYYLDEGATEAEDYYSTMARDNLVASYDLSINLPDQNVLLGGEIAGSMLNKNTIPGPMTQEDIQDWSGEELPIDPSDYSSIIIINKNMEPFLPSRANLAWNAYFRSLIWNNFLNVQYSQTGQSFNAFGASYQMNDSSVLSFTDQINVYRYLVLSGGLNLTEDNLMSHKSETNKYTNWYVQSIIRIPQAPYLKLAFYNNMGKNENNEEIEAPFTPYERKAMNMSVGIGYNFNQLAQVPTQLDISYRTGNDNSTLNNIDSTDNLNNSLNITMNNRFSVIPLTTQFSMSLNNQQNKLADMKTNNSSLLFGAGYGFLDNRIKPFTNYRMVSLGGDQDKRNYGYFTLGVEAYPFQDFSLTSDVAFNSFSSDNDTETDYNSTTWRVFLTQRF